MPAVYIALVADADYPALRQKGRPSDFPEEWDFLRLVDTWRNAYRDRGYTTKDVYIDPAGLRCARARHQCATYEDLLKYAARMALHGRK